MICQKCGAAVPDNAAFCSRCGNKIELPKKNAPSGEKIELDLSKVWLEWQVESQLGRGSYGTVYRAVRRDNNIEIYSAIKVISIPSNVSEINSLRAEGYNESSTRDYFKGIVDEFVGEVQLMESLRGTQNIVSVEDYKVVEKTDEIGWTIYIRMELLTAFNDFICDRTLSEQEVIKIGVDICSALEICQKRNIIHRDIKPENIFINDFGFFKLGDFGIARRLENATGGLSQKGTFNYMAPEVARGTHYDARVDIYSLGIVLYRLLNKNRFPFLDTDKQFLSPHDRKIAVDRRLSGETLPAPCNASPEMADIILRACAYDPNRRFANPTVMKNALNQALYGAYVIPAVADVDRTASVGTMQEVDRTVPVNRAPYASGTGLYGNATATVRVARPNTPNISRPATNAGFTSVSRTPQSQPPNRLAEVAAEFGKPHSEEINDILRTLSLGQLVLSNPDSVAQKIVAKSGKSGRGRW